MVLGNPQLRAVLIELCRIEIALQDKIDGLREVLIELCRIEIGQLRAGKGGHAVLIELCRIEITYSNFDRCETVMVLIELCRIEIRGRAQEPLRHRRS